MAGSSAALGEVLLVICLGAVKRAGGFDFRDDGTIESVGGFERRDGFKRGGFLFSIVKENRGAILRAEDACKVTS